MNCSACGHVNPDRAKFCLDCGTPFRLACGQCGTALPAGARFCLECGTAVAVGGSAADADDAAGSANAAAPRTAPTASTTPERTPADYTPKHLADKIFQSRSALEGERKQVTVLFADVKGSMELAERLDPETWHGILDGLFHILSDGVHRFEGTVNQYTGDGIMALFGAPIAHEDHAQRACYAALHLVDAVRKHALEVRRRHGLDLAFRLGLNSGEVVVGRIGDDLRMDYTAAGHSVGLAQALLHCGEEKRALDVARASVEYCERFGIVFSEFDAQLELATVATAHDELEEARAAVARSAELVERMECRVLAPRVLEAQAEVAAARGDSEGQGRLLREAMVAYQGLGAVGHARRVGGALGA